MAIVHTWEWYKILLWYSACCSANLSQPTGIDVLFRFLHFRNVVKKNDVLQTGRVWMSVPCVASISVGYDANRSVPCLRSLVPKVCAAPISTHSIMFRNLAYKLPQHDVQEGRREHTIKYS